MPDTPDTKRAATCPTCESPKPEWDTFSEDNPCPDDFHSPRPVSAVLSVIEVERDLRAQLAAAEARAAEAEQRLRDKAASFEQSADQFEREAETETQARSIRKLIQADCYRQAASELRALLTPKHPQDEESGG